MQTPFSRGLTLKAAADKARENKKDESSKQRQEPANSVVEAIFKKIGNRKMEAIEERRQYHEDVAQLREQVRGRFHEAGGDATLGDVLKSVAEYGLAAWRADSAKQTIESWITGRTPVLKAKLEKHDRYLENALKSGNLDEGELDRLRRSALGTARADSERLFSSDELSEEILQELIERSENIKAQFNESCEQLEYQMEADRE